MHAATHTPSSDVDEASARAALRKKLAWMRRLRDDAARGLPPDRAELKALAAEFPGALRELDDTPLAALEARASELEGDRPLPQWALATWLYHAALRRDLEATRRGKRPLGGLVERAVSAVAAHLGLETHEVEALALPHARRRRR